MAKEVADKLGGHLALVKGGLPLHLQSAMLEDAGKGVSHAQEDNIVPLIYVLQSGSPVLKRSNPAYIEGAQAGDIWLKNSIHTPIVRGDEGILFQPCFFDKVWIEWRPNRGGFAGRHKERPVDAKQITKQHEGREVTVWQRANGNELVETREHMGFAGSEAYVIPFSSTGHTSSRTWMQLMNQNIIPGAKGVAPSFSKWYLLRTIEKTNTAGSWFSFKVEPADWVSTEDYERGRALFQAFKSGEKQVAAQEELGGQNDLGTSHDDDPPF